MLVIFDCDGVLIDSEIISNEVGVEMLAKLGLPHTLEEMTQRFLGLSGATAHIMLEKDFGGPLPSWFKEESATRLDAAFEKNLKPIPGILELLEQLPHPVCVASSSTLRRLKLNLTYAGLYDRFFPHIFSTEMVARGKPHPDIFLYAAAQMGFAPEDCIVIEDSVNGVLAAHAAGIDCFGFTGGGHCDAAQAERLREAGATEIVCHMDDLARLLMSAPKTAKA